MSDLSTELERIFSEFKTDLDLPHDDFVLALSSISRRAEEVGETDVQERAFEIKNALKYFKMSIRALTNPTTTREHKEKGVSMLRSKPTCQQADLDAELLSIFSAAAALPEQYETLAERQAWTRFCSEQDLHWSNRKDQEKWPEELFEHYAPLIRLKGMTSSKIPQNIDLGVVDTVMNSDRPLSAAVRSLLSFFRGDTEGNAGSHDSPV